MDFRSIVRGVALQTLYEIEMSAAKRPQDILRFRGASEIPEYDARLLGYLALLKRYGSLPTTTPTAFSLPISKPLDSRTSLEQILIDLLTDGVAEESISPEHIAELESQVIVPDTEEFDLVLSDPVELLSLEYQKALQDIVVGVQTHKARLDALIFRYAREWPLEHVATIDRNVLRIAIYEMGFNNMRLKVAINEAIELAKRFGSERSAPFVNGVLGAIVNDYAEDIQTALAEIAAEQDASQTAEDALSPMDTPNDNMLSLSPSSTNISEDN